MTTCRDQTAVPMLRTVIRTRYGACVAVPETHEVAPEGGIRLARGPLLAVAGAVVALLVATSWRYGFHRDELYFLVAGQHPDWGYPDQPPMTPILTRLMAGSAGRSSSCGCRARSRPAPPCCWPG